jgi:hypothetical protein
MSTFYTLFGREEWLHSWLKKWNRTWQVNTTTHWNKCNWQTKVLERKTSSKMTIKKVPQFRFNISFRRKNKLALRMFDGTVIVQHKNSTSDQKESFMRAQMWHPDSRLNMIDRILIPPRYTFFSGSPSAKNPGIKRAWSGAILGWVTNREVFPSVHKWGQKCTEKIRVGLWG